MKKVDPEVFDKLLAVLFEGDRAYSVAVAETLREIFGKQAADRSDFYQVYGLYMAELTEYGLATERPESGTDMDITALGRKVHKAGGWTKYNQLLTAERATEQTRQTQAHQATLDSATATVDAAKAAKSSARAAWIVGAVALIPTLISVLQYIDSTSKNTDINELRSQLKSLSQQVQAQKPTRIENQLRGDSLPTPQKLKK